MIPIIIGISSGLLTILLIAILKQLDKTVMYGLILSGIGFLYVGYVWANLQALVVNSIQAIAFLLVAYYGVKKSVTILALGYLMHGCWDIAYGFFKASALIPPHYDLFCSSLDFTICAYILILKSGFAIKNK